MTKKRLNHNSLWSLLPRSETYEKNWGIHRTIRPPRARSNRTKQGPHSKVFRYSSSMRIYHCYSYYSPDVTLVSVSSEQTDEASHLHLEVRPALVSPPQDDSDLPLDLATSLNVSMDDSGAYQVVTPNIADLSATDHRYRDTGAQMVAATSDISISAVSENADAGVQTVVATTDQGSQVSMETYHRVVMQDTTDNGECDTHVEAASRDPHIGDPDAYMGGREGTECPAGTPIVTCSQSPTDVNDLESIIRDSLRRGRCVLLCKEASEVPIVDALSLRLFAGAEKRHLRVQGEHLPIEVYISTPSDAERPDETIPAVEVETADDHSCRGSSKRKKTQEKGERESIVPEMHSAPQKLVRHSASYKSTEMVEEHFQSDIDVTTRPSKRARVGYLCAGQDKVTIHDYPTCQGRSSLLVCLSRT